MEQLRHCKGLLHKLLRLTILHWIEGLILYMFVGLSAPP
jgi:hypothetical protein